MDADSSAKAAVVILVCYLAAILWNRLRDLVDDLTLGDPDGR